MKTLVLTNTLANINAFVYSNHCQFWAHTVREFPKDDFLFMTPNRMSIDMARNLAAKQAIALDFDYILFIDDDVLVPHDAFGKLLRANKDVVAGLGCIRGFPFDVMAFKERIRKEKAKGPQGDLILDDNGKEVELEHKTLTNYNDIPTKHFLHTDDNGKDCENCKDERFIDLVELVECGAIGFSLCLINLDVLKAMRPPYFVTLPNCTEDVYFCTRIKEELTPTPEIYMHTGVRWGHMLNAEPIEWGTRKKFQEFYVEDAINKNITESEMPDGRNLEYITKVLAKMG